MDLKIKSTDYAYLSGYLDGDGCFHISILTPKKWRREKYISTLIITSVNKCTLDKFCEQFEGSVQKSGTPPERHRQLYQWTLRKKCFSNIAHNILPFLVEKQDQCKLAMDFMLSTSDEERRSYINQMKILKDVSHLVSKHHLKILKECKKTVNPVEGDFAYLAGFIDAECCLSISKHKPKDRPNNVYKIYLKCNNTKFPVFKWLSDRFGGQFTFINRLNTQKSRKNQIMWTLSGKALSKLLPRIYPYLRYKKPVCEQLIKFYDTTLTNGGARHTEEFRSSYEKTIKIREKIIEVVHQLNLKGPKPISG